MNKCNLILHCGAAEVPRKALATVPTPAPTETWRPIPHEEYIRQVEWELPRYGLDIVHEAHALTHDSSRYFGLIQVQNGCNSPDYSWVLGLRNSHDKTLTAGLVAGSSVFVCDNLSFSGEVYISRKHTSYILEDLPGLIGNALGRLLLLFRAQDQRVERYRATRLSDADAHDLTIQALDKGVVCASKIPALLHEWREPRYEDFEPRTVWSFFNATTEVLKGALHLLPKRSQTLYQLCDQYAAV
ncbi:MAG TPA: DUF932 domain-containing protein [Bryobacteraceae bacterium]|nr:DUF932 domain-containing protein [Bryobacteraceae bacterium]